MRVAWLGPTPSDHGGAPFVGTQLLLGLARAGVEVDCFVAAPPQNLPVQLFAEPRIGLHCKESAWQWGKWYSRTPMVSFFSGHASRAWSQLTLADEIARRHSENPYDVVYQFSQSEMLSLRRRASDLPPILVHPSTHAAGELRWHRREAALSRRCEPARKRAVVRAMLMTRAAIQRRDIHLASRVVGVSKRFVEHLEHDYRIPRERLGAVRNPIDLDRFQARTDEPSGGPIELLYVSRMSARKGVEMVVELSHRLADLEGRVRIRAIGGCTMWSDYRPLLSDLNSGTAIYEGPLSPAGLSEAYRGAGAVLQPSHYEPFALTVGEGLASGVPAVASDEVGAIDGLDPDVCRVFEAGDNDGFERTVRDLVAELEDGRGAALAPLARSEAERLFAPETVTEALIEQLELAAGLTRPAEPREPAAAV